jgi:hypothetical protein
MTVYSNRYRGRLVTKLALLVFLPVLLATFAIGFLELSFLTGTWSPDRIVISASAATGVAVSLTAIAIGSTVPKCPTQLNADGVSLRYRRYRWIGRRPGFYSLEFPLASVKSVGPTAIGATGVDGVAFAQRLDDDKSAPREVTEHLLLAPETAELIGLRPNRGFVFWTLRDGRL